MPKSCSDNNSKTAISINLSVSCDEQNEFLIDRSIVEHAKNHKARIAFGNRSDQYNSV